MQLQHPRVHLRVRPILALRVVLLHTVVLLLPSHPLPMNTPSMLAHTCVTQSHTSLTLYSVLPLYAGLGLALPDARGAKVLAVCRVNLLSCLSRLMVLSAAPSVLCCCWGCLLWMQLGMCVRVEDKR